MANFSIKRGDTFVKGFTWKTDGVPNDLTGYGVEFTVTTGCGATPVVYDENDPEVTVTPLTGHIEIRLPDTSDWPDSVSYDLTVISATPDRLSLVDGLIVVR